MGKATSNTDFNVPRYTISTAKDYYIDNRCRVHFLMDDNSILKDKKFYGRRLAKRYAKNRSMVSIALTPVIPLDCISIDLIV